MKAGMTLQLSSFGSKSDLQTYAEELSLVDLAENLGFDSIWCLEHHFTGHVMSPDPAQLLAYVAARTRRVQLGTAVIVLPWHDPVKIAEKIALLDILSGGRTVFGFGRGAAAIEYAGFRIPMEEARERFAESATVIRKALTQETFSHNGKYYRIPELQIRPRPISRPETRFYASTVSPESAEMMARLGFGVLVIAQRAWEETASDYSRYRQTAAEHGFIPRPPIGQLNVILANDAHEAEDLAGIHMETMFDAIDRHYRFSDGHLASVKGYEFYGKMAKTYGKLHSDPKAKAKAVEFYRSLHAVGTPSQVLQKLRYIHETIALEELIVTFAVGGLPHKELERSVRLFAHEVMPVLREDAAFRLPP